jgi:hypothetical protein
MPVPDTFSYTARWDSVGLDCSSCTHFVGPKTWPDTSRVSSCSLHKVSLEIELSSNGYKYWEWFCSNFSDDGSAYFPAVAHFDEIHGLLKRNVLYRLYSDNGFLIENEISQLPKSA